MRACCVAAMTGAACLSILPLTVSLPLLLLLLAPLLNYDGDGP